MIIKICPQQSFLMVVISFEVSSLKNSKPLTQLDRKPVTISQPVNPKLIQGGRTERFEDLHCSVLGPSTKKTPVSPTHLHSNLNQEQISLSW